MDKIKELKLGICFLDDDDNVISKRVVGTNWTLNMDEEDSMKDYKMHFFDEIARVLCDNLKLQLTEETVLDMIKELHNDF